MLPSGGPLEAPGKLAQSMELRCRSCWVTKGRLGRCWVSQSEFLLVTVNHRSIARGATLLFFPLSLSSCCHPLPLSLTPLPHPLDTSSSYRFELAFAPVPIISGQKFDLHFSARNLEVALVFLYFVPVVYISKPWSPWF